ncbi:MAG TPA: hypothetical protein VGS19_11990, partial [Streptosporangiaceae bacterium]|nr:hypothetical protein [Streptosporangiaceae bacterium]
TPNKTPVSQARHETTVAREIRARCLVAGMTPAEIAEAIHDGCGPVAGTSWIRAYRLALGISLADVVAQVRARYASEGRAMPRFCETLLSAYESGQKRPGPEYLHYLCSVYRAEPAQLGYPDQCFCGRPHRDVAQEPPAPATISGTEARGVCTEAIPPSHVPSERLRSGRRLRPPRRRPTKVPAAAPGMAASASRTRSVPAATGESVADPVDRRDAGDEGDHDVLRGALVRMIAHSAASVDGQFLGAVDRIRRRMDDALVKGTVSATMLDQWEETTAGYGRQYMSIPPLRLLCDVLLDLGDVRRMCEHRQPLDFSERLCRLAGHLAGLAGVIMIDVGDQRLARSFFRTARTAADETGDRHLRGWVTARETLVPMYYGDPREACALARAATGLAGPNPCVAGVMAPVLEARSLARAAAHRDPAARRPALRKVSALLGHAHNAFDRLPASQRSDTAFGYTERQLHFHEGDALVTLGHHQAAEKAFQRAMALYSPQEVLDRSLVALGIARCRLEADEPEEALRLVRETLLAVPHEHRSQIMVRVARSLGDSAAVRHGDFRAVREYREAVPSA